MVTFTIPFEITAGSEDLYTSSFYESSSHSGSTNGVLGSGGTDGTINAYTLDMLETVQMGAQHQASTSSISSLSGSSSRSSSQIHATTGTNSTVNQSQAGSQFVYLEQSTIRDSDGNYTTYGLQSSHGDTTGGSSTIYSDTMYTSTLTSHTETIGSASTSGMLTTRNTYDLITSTTTDSTITGYATFETTMTVDDIISGSNSGTYFTDSVINTISSTSTSATISMLTTSKTSELSILGGIIEATVLCPDETDWLWIFHPGEDLSNYTDSYHRFDEMFTGTETDYTVEAQISSSSSSPSVIDSSTPQITWEYIIWQLVATTYTGIMDYTVLNTVHSSYGNNTLPMDLMTYSLSYQELSSKSSVGARSTSSLFSNVDRLSTTRSDISITSTTTNSTLFSYRVSDGGQTTALSTIPYAQGTTTMTNTTVAAYITSFSQSQSNAESTVSGSTTYQDGENGIIISAVGSTRTDTFFTNASLFLSRLASDQSRIYSEYERAFQIQPDLAKTAPLYIGLSANASMYYDEGMMFNEVEAKGKAFYRIYYPGKDGTTGTNRYEQFGSGVYQISWSTDGKFSATFFSSDTVSTSSTTSTNSVFGIAAPYILNRIDGIRGIGPYHYGGGVNRYGSNETVFLQGAYDVPGGTSILHETMSSLEIPTNSLSAFKIVEAWKAGPGFGGYVYAYSIFEKHPLGI